MRETAGLFLLPPLLKFLFSFSACWRCRLFGLSGIIASGNLLGLCVLIVMIRGYGLSLFASADSSRVWAVIPWYLMTSCLGCCIGLWKALSFLCLMAVL